MERSNEAITKIFPTILSHTHTYIIYVTTSKDLEDTKREGVH